ncbi:hypothetical protein EJ065_6513 [Corallococcus coralloides]|uniref:Uncharacterized protein n=1 Tax=Corallococcus coralloides TaxID=184914 RepID=A0A410S1N7_CORCK|nr:hypothetical protein [Corallococcus coralloides]QAT88042.1 hypothetical protein EJ065_6513 [Corallococcus coralloides]
MSPVNLDSIHAYVLAAPDELGGLAMDPGTAPHLDGAGLYFRLLPHPEMALPRTHLRVFRHNLGFPATALTRRDIDWRDANGDPLFPPFNVTTGSPVTGYLPETGTCTWLSLNLSGTVNLTLDAHAFTPTGRTLILSKSSGPYTVTATPINAIVLTGKTTVNGVRWLAAQDVLDAARDANTPLFRRMALPIPSGTFYQGITNANAQAVARLARTAPKRRGMDESPDAVEPAQCPAATPQDEQARLTPLIPEINSRLQALVNTATPESLTESQPLNAPGGAGANNALTMGRLSLLYQALHDPGIASWVGLFDADLSPPTTTAGHVVAYIIAGTWRSRHPPIIIEAAPSTGASEPSPRALFEPTELAVVLCAAVGRTPAAPPVPTLGPVRLGPWMPAAVPQARRQVAVPVGNLLDGGTVSFIRGEGTTFTSLHAMSGGRARPRMPTRLTEPARGELVDTTAPAVPVTYRVAQRDPLGRWGNAGTVNAPALARPPPPAPTLRVAYEPPPVPSPMPLGMLSGTLRVRVPVPAPGALAPGANLLDRIELTLDGVPFVQNVGAAAEQSFDIPGPPLERAGKREVTLVARFVDTGGVASAASETQRLVLRDPRSALTPAVAPGLRFTTRPDATGRARVRLAFTTATGQRAFRLFYSDERRLLHHLQRLVELGGPEAPRAQAALEALAAASDAAVRAPLFEREASLFGRELFEPVGAPIDAPATPGEQRLEHDVPASLRVLSFYRVLSVSEAQVESPFHEAILVPVAVLRDDTPQRPVLEVSARPEEPGQPLTARVRIRVPRGPFTAAEFRLLRGLEGGQDLNRMVVVAQGPIAPASDPDGVQEAEFRDTGASPLAPSKTLRPFIRYTWRAQVRAAPAPGGGPPAAWSEPSALVATTFVPQLPPGAVTGLAVQQQTGPAALRFGHPDPLLDGGPVGRYLFEVDRQLPGEQPERIKTLPADLPPTSGGRGADGLFRVTDTRIVPVGTRYRVCLRDPLGRASPPALCTLESP